ncbi:MAG: DUF5991 domain-containing protein [Eubacteriales bacterium]|jgi:hypothetical protein
MKSNFDETSESLDSWLGDYIYNEFVPPNINQHYAMQVYKENGSYFADISVDGFQAAYSIKTKAVGDSNCIRFFYASELNKETNSLFRDNDLLLSLLAENGKIQTVWEKLSCLESNRYFEKLYTDYYGSWQITETGFENGPDSCFSVGDKLVFSKDQFITGDDPLTVTSHTSYVLFPDFLQQKASSAATADNLTRSLLYEGTYAEITLSDASGDILYIYPFSDSECLMIDAQNAVYRAKKLA